MRWTTWRSILSTLFLISSKFRSSYNSIITIKVNIQISSKYRFKFILNILDRVPNIDSRGFILQFNSSFDNQRILPRNTINTFYIFSKTGRYSRRIMHKEQVMVYFTLLYINYIDILSIIVSNIIYSAIENIVKYIIVSRLQSHTTCIVHQSISSNSSMRSTISRYTLST